MFAQGIMAYTGPGGAGGVPYLVAAVGGADRVRADQNPAYSAVAYYEFLKRSMAYAELYPSVIPLPGTLTAQGPAGSSPGIPNARPTIQHTNPAVEESGQHERIPSGSGEIVPKQVQIINPEQGHPLSPNSVKSRDLKFGIDRILHPAEKQLAEGNHSVN